MGIVEQSFSSGEVIIREGDIGNSFFRILDGNVGVYSDYGKKEQFRIAVLKSGDYFGEMAVIEEYPRSATIVAECSVRVLEITENALDKYFSENPDEVIKFVTHLGNKVRTMVNDYNDAQALLKETREADTGKKNKLLFFKIKKHATQYEPSKPVICEPNPDKIRKAFEEITDEGPGRIGAFDNGAIIFEKGQEDNCLCIVRGGKVGLYDNYGTPEQVKTKELTDVSFFGEMGMLADQPRECTAVAESDETYIEFIYKDDLASVCQACPVKIDMIVRYLSYRLRKLTADFVEICKQITESYNK